MRRGTVPSEFWERKSGIFADPKVGPFFGLIFGAANQLLYCAAPEIGPFFGTKAGDAKLETKPCPGLNGESPQIGSRRVQYEILIAKRLVSAIFGPGVGGTPSGGFGESRPVQSLDLRALFLMQKARCVHIACKGDRRGRFRAPAFSSKSGSKNGAAKPTRRAARSSTSNAGAAGVRLPAET